LEDIAFSLLEFNVRAVGFNKTFSRSSSGMVRALKAGDFHSPESSPNPWIIDKNTVLHY
jgi:hypothetical protein